MNSGKKIIKHAVEQMTKHGEFLLYQSEDSLARVQVRFQDHGIWLTQAQLAELYQCSSQNITQHIGAIYKSGELTEEATCKPYLQVRQERDRQISRSIKHYNLEVVLAVGYRAKSHRGTQFRNWATYQLTSYLKKGFYWMMSVSRAGRTAITLRNCWRVSAIFALQKRCFGARCWTFMPRAWITTPIRKRLNSFLQQHRTRCTGTAHGHTAAALIMQRTDVQAPNMGLTNSVGVNKGAPIRKTDVGIAKNYLNAEELDTLNRIVTAYIEVAELQAQARQAMTMRNWATDLDNFLRLTRKDILTHAGKVPAEAALAKAQAVFSQYQSQVFNLPSQVEKDFEESLAKPVKQLAKKRIELLKNKKKE